MNKQPNHPGKMTLVRNTEQKLPKVTVRTCEGTSKPEPPEPQPQPERHVRKPDSKPCRFDRPKPNSSKDLEDRMRQVRSAKSVEFKPREGEALIEEKITKKMNFPIDKAIYKGLTPLCVTSESSKVTASRNPLPPKDVEPNLSDFYMPERLPEYVFKIESEGVKRGKLKPVPFDGHSISKSIRNWEERNYEMFRNK